MSECEMVSQLPSSQKARTVATNLMQVPISVCTEVLPGVVVWIARILTLVSCTSAYSDAAGYPAQLPGTTPGAHGSPTPPVSDLAVLCRCFGYPQASQITFVRVNGLSAESPLDISQLRCPSYM